MALMRDLYSNPTKALRPRIIVMMWLVGVAFIALVLRVYTLQILRGDELAQKGRRNVVQRVRVSHDRGIIFDRHGRILADNRPSLDAQVTPAFLAKPDGAEVILQQLTGLIALTTAEIERARKLIASKSGLDLFRPIVIKRDLTSDQVEAVEAERSVFRLDGVEVVEGRRRTYPYGMMAAHLLGYVKEIDPGELDAERARGNPRHYFLGDTIGRDGVERAHEKDLRGVDGYEHEVVDAKGRRQHDAYVLDLLRDQQRLAPQPGKNVFLTIDIELQKRAEAAFDGRAGVVVVLNPRDGDILALVSVPAFDPNLVSGLLGKEEKSRLDADPLKPWINRTIQGQYAPGSTFKAFSALAALEQRVTNPREKVNCPGYYKMGRQKWRCYKESGHGKVDLHAAIKVSCDTYFYTMAGRMGINPIAEMARAFGFGVRTGILLRNEQPGLIPDEAYHDRVDRATGGYQRGMSVNSVIGQGSVLVTPLQLAFGFSVIANGGTLFQPQLVERIETADFRVIRRFLPRARALTDIDGAGDSEAHRRADRDVAPATVVENVIGSAPEIFKQIEATMVREIDLAAEDLAEVRAGLIAVTSERGGTAYWRRSRKVTMGGKTGTSQVIRLGPERLKLEEIPYEERDHAWFVAFAPAGDPQIVVAVLNEHAGHGSSHAAPIAVRVIDAYFELAAESKKNGARQASEEDLVAGKAVP